MEDIHCWEEKFEVCQYSERLLNLLSQLNSQLNLPVEILKVKQAIYYARKYHGSQMRKSGEPYYSHPIEVAYMFAEYVSKKNKEYYATNLVVTEILHDSIEDTMLTKAMIAEIFGESVASKVEDLTRIKFDKKITAGETLELLYHQYKIDILYIKLFDRLHNIQNLGAMPAEKRQKIAQETIKYFITLGDCLGLGDLMQELRNLTYQALSVPPHQVFANSSIFC